LNVWPSNTIVPDEAPEGDVGPEHPTATRIQSDAVITC
jgi:hypothetical protein